MPFKRIFPESFNADHPLVVMGHASVPALGDRISLLVWNIYKAKKPHWQESFTALAEGRDIVLLQESIFNTRHKGLFEDSARFEWIMARSHTYHHNQLTTGLKSGAVAPSTGQRFLSSPDREPILKTMKLALRTEYPLQHHDQTLLVINVHAINFVSLTKYIRHITQVLSLIKDHTGPVILAGDFNCWNEARAAFLFDCMKQEGLMAALPQRKALWRHLNRHIDHIFYRGLTLETVATRADVKTSDHYPLVAEFSVA